MPKLLKKKWKVKKRTDGFYLTNLPEEFYPEGEMGPSSSLDALRELEQGLKRFINEEMHRAPTREKKAARIGEEGGEEASYPKRTFSQTSPTPKPPTKLTFGKSLLKKGIGKAPGEEEATGPNQGTEVCSVRRVGRIKPGRGMRSVQR